MAVTYITKPVFTFPASLSGYSGFATPEYPTALSEFQFALQDEWTVSKIFSRPWRDAFEMGPESWDSRRCSSHINCIERPANQLGCGDVSDPRSGTAVQFIRDQLFTAGLTPPEGLGGLAGWNLYPNFYNDAGDDMTGNYAGYTPVATSAPGLDGFSGNWCMRVKTFNKPIVPPEIGFEPADNYGGAWIDLNKLGVTGQLTVGRYYRITFYTKSEVNQGQAYFGFYTEEGNVHSDDTGLSVSFSPGMLTHGANTEEEVANGWVKHTSIRKLRSLPDRVSIWSRVPNQQFLVDNITLEDVEVTLTYPTHKILWDFGDGAFSSSLTGKHVYKWPGIYEVKCILYNQYGDRQINTLMPTVSVYNVITERLQLDSSVDNFTTELPACDAGFDASIPLFKVNRYNTWQSFPNLSATGYTLNLYASGSKSKSLNVDRFFDEKWSHLDQTWSFYKSITTAGVQDWMPVTSVDTTNTELYYRWVVDLSLSAEPGQHLKIEQCAASATGAAFVGTSGYGEFKYIDDLPNNTNLDVYNPGPISENPILLFASFETKNFPPSRDNSLTNHIENYTGIGVVESQKLIIPVTIVPTQGFGLKFTSTGQRQMPISKNKWVGTPIPFFLSTTDNKGNIVETYPPLTGNFGNEVPIDGVINISLGDEDGVAQPADFYKDNLTGLPADVRSKLFGFLVPGASGVNATHNAVSLSATMTSIKGTSGMEPAVVNPKAITLRSFLPGNASYWWPGTISFVNRITDLGSQANPGPVQNWRTSLQRGESGVDGGAKELLGTATVFDSMSGVNARTHSWFADAYEGFLYKIDQNGDRLLTVNVSSAAGYMAPDYRPGVGLPDAPRPMSLLGVAIDREKNAWVTAHDGGFAAKIDPVSGTCLATVSSNSLSGFQPGFPGNSALPAEDFYPTAIDTDVDSNVWISFTNPLCCFVQKFNGTTGLPVTGSFLGFEPGEKPVDLVVDQSSNAYVITNCWDSYAFKTVTVPAVSAYRGVGTSFLPILTGMGPNQAGGSDNMGYMLSGADAATMQLAAILSGHGAFNIQGFDVSKDIPGYDSTYCDDMYNGWGWKGNSFDTTNNILWLGIHPTRMYPRGCPRNYSAVTSVTAADVNLTYHPGGKLYKLNTTGTLLWTVSGLYSPGNITTDAGQNVWVTDRNHTVAGYNSKGQLIENYDVGYLDGLLGDYGGNSTVGVPYDRINRSPIDNRLLGIAATEYGTINVIHHTDNALHYLTRSTETGKIDRHHSQSLREASGYSQPPVEEHRAFGDFTGFNWRNKYNQNYPSITRMGGNTTFNIYPSAGHYNVAKFNEDFDAKETIKSYRQQEFLLDSTNFFDNFYGEIVGDSNSYPTEIGKTIYEKIANFLSNHNDVDTCNVNSLHSLAEQYNVPITDYNLPYPPSLRRIMDIGSVKHSKLWGGRSKYNENFDLDYNSGSALHHNLGAQIPLSAITTTYMLTAGESIVLRQTFNNEFRLIEPMVIDNPETFGSALYDTSTYPLTTYPMSAFSNSWGWNIDPVSDNKAISGVELGNYYDFYKFVPGFENKQREGLLDWSNKQTATITESMSALSAWYDDNMMLENMIEYELRKGTYNFSKPALSADKITVSNFNPSDVVSVSSSIAVSISPVNNKYVMNGIQSPLIWAKRGSAIVFNTDITTSTDPFRILESPDGNIYTGGAVYASNGAGAGGSVTWTPPLTAPGLLFYGSLSSRNLGFGIGLIS